MKRKREGLLEELQVKRAKYEQIEMKETELKCDIMQLKYELNNLIGINRFPNEVMGLILQHLEVEDLFACERVCRRWNGFVRQFGKAELIISELKERRPRKWKFSKSVPCSPKSTIVRSGLHFEHLESSFVIALKRLKIVDGKLGESNSRYDPELLPCDLKLINQLVNLEVLEMSFIDFDATLTLPQLRYLAIHRFVLEVKLKLATPELRHYRSQSLEQVEFVFKEKVTHLHLDKYDADCKQLSNLQYLCLENDGFLEHANNTSNESQASGGESSDESQSSDGSQSSDESQSSDGSQSSDENQSLDGNQHPDDSKPSDGIQSKDNSHPSGASKPSEDIKSSDDSQASNNRYPPNDSHPSSDDHPSNADQSPSRFLQDHSNLKMLSIRPNFNYLLPSIYRSAKSSALQILEQKKRLKRDDFKLIFFGVQLENADQLEAFKFGSNGASLIGLHLRNYSALCDEELRWVKRVDLTELAWWTDHGLPADFYERFDRVDQIVMLYDFGKENIALLKKFKNLNSLIIQQNDQEDTNWSDFERMSDEFPNIWLLHFEYLEGCDFDDLNYFCRFERFKRLGRLLTDARYCKKTVSSLLQKFDEFEISFMENEHNLKVTKRSKNSTFELWKRGEENNHAWIFHRDFNHMEDVHEEIEKTFAD